MAEARRTRLRNAPIVEAVIDIRFEPLAPLERIGAMAAEFAAGGSILDIWDTQFEIKATDGEAPQMRHAAAQSGKRVQRPGDPHVAGLRTGGVSLSRLAPYDSWESLAAAADRVWTWYLPTVGATTTTRLAVRYINSLDLQLPIPDFRAYLNSPPEVPSGLPQSVSSFLHRTMLLNEEGDSAAIVTQSLEGGVVGADALKFILDIDVFQESPVGAHDFNAIRGVLEHLRAFKNAIFFGYLTDQALERYR